MAHSSIKPIWKYSCKPEGYGVETLEFDTSSSAPGSFLKLPHSFFRAAEFAATIPPGTVLTVGCENATLTGKEDIVLRSYDSRLSQLCNTGIYRAIEVLSKRAKNKNLTLKLNFIADAFDPEDFNQALNPDADVEHRSLKTQSMQSEFLLVSEATLKSLTGDWGTITSEAVEFNSKELSLYGLRYKDGVLSIDSPLELTSEKGKVRYNPETLLWEVWNHRSSKYVPVVISREAVSDIPVGAIPYIEEDDKAAQSYSADFFLKDKTLHIPKLETDAVSIQNESLDIRASEISWKGHTLRVLADGTLDIDNLLQINKKTGTVRIGNVSFDKTLLTTLLKLEKKDSL